MIKAERIKSIVARFEIEFENGDEDPIKKTAALEYVYAEDLTPNKKLVLEVVKSLGQIFEDFFNKNVEENNS